MCESFDLGLICIRICITRVPAYVKWMWQNQKLLDTTKVSFSRTCLFEPVVIYIICLILFVCITSHVLRDVPQPRDSSGIPKGFQNPQAAGSTPSNPGRLSTVPHHWILDGKIATFIFQVDTVK